LGVDTWRRPDTVGKAARRFNPENFLHPARKGGRVNKQLVATFVLLSALWGAGSVAIADDEDSLHHNSDRPVPKLFDANGKYVGNVVYFGEPEFGDPGVILNIHGALVYASIKRPLDSPTQLQWHGFGPSYSGPNCSGTVFVQYARGPFRPAAIVRSGATATLYVASGTLQQMVTVQSTVTGPPETCWSESSSYVIPAWTVESTFDLTQHYPEPLRVGF
jgi:hypothetical protein